MDNKASSVINNTYHYLVYLKNGGCNFVGTCYLNDGPASHRTNLTYDKWTNWNVSGSGCNENANDKISSVYVYN
jgi:hypothetical protein